VAETQQVIIEFLANDEQLDSAINKLEKTGEVDSKLAQDFKKNTAEISKQAVEIQKTAAAATPLKKSLEDVAKAVKSTTTAFVTGFHEGVEGALKDAGVSISELKQKLGLFNKESPFEKLSNSLSEARDRVLNISAAMAQLQRTGGVDTEQFERLGKLLEQRQSELERVQVEYDKVTSSLDQNTKKTEDNTVAIDENAKAQEDLKKKLDSLKQRLESTTKDAAFDKLSKSVSDARDKVLNITAAMVQLKKNGGIDTEQFKKLEASLKSSKDTLNQLEAQYDEVTDSVKRSTEATDENDAAQDGLRQRLKILTQQIAEMKAAGDDGTEAFQKLVIEAGNIKNAMGGAAAEIKNASSGTKTFDNLIGSAQAVAGGFAVAQGAVALFGDENKDLEKTMLKVNAAIAITQGLQGISAALEKEGALSLLATNIQLKVKNAQKVIETGLESESIVVRGAATAAQWALNAAMSANPIGLLVVAVAGLIAILSTYGKSAAKARQETSNLNVELGQGVKNFEEQQENIKRSGESMVNQLENQGASESKIAAQRLETEKQLAEGRTKRLNELRESQSRNLEADLDQRIKISDEIRKLSIEDDAEKSRLLDLEFKQQKTVNQERLKNAVAGIEAELSAAEEGSQKQLNLQRALITTRTALELNADGLLENERAAIAAKGNEDRLEAEAAFNKRRIDLQLKVVEAQLVNVREGSQEELDLKKQAIKLQSNAELTNTKLSEKEKQAIKEKSFQDQLKLQREFNERVRREAIEGQISINEAQISQIKTNDEDRLILQIANIELAAVAEVDAAKGNSAKIKEINAKRDADILAVKKKFIDDAAQYEIDIRTADNGPSTRALQRIVADERKGLDLRKSAIKQLADFQISNIDIQLAALEEEKNKKLISEKDYILKYKQLQDKKAEITEESEKATTDLIKAENVKRIQTTIEVLSKVADLIQSINETETQEENDRITALKERTSELLDAGAITEEQAKARNKRIEAEEKKAKAAQAKREKDVAVFRALLAIPQAILEGLTQGGPFLAAIYGGLAAAQAVIIASRPLPRFGHGKKSGYEGPAEIGETGSELYEQNGRMFLADKKQIVWLGAKDKVYNPIETKEMLMPVVDKQLMQWQAPAQKQESIDYDKLAQAVGKHINIPGFNIDEKGFQIWQEKGLNRTNYMDKRYSSK
jgi:hypothetical protein